jgi:hypothetical protein
MGGPRVSETPRRHPRPDVVAGSSPDDSTLVVLTRLEAKVDVALAHHGASIDAHRREIDDHEGRLRRLEERRTISPRELWGAVGSGAAFVLVVVNLWNALNLGA